jgi:hypothetical protein
MEAIEQTCFHYLKRKTFEELEENIDKLNLNNFPLYSKKNATKSEKNLFAGHEAIPVSFRNSISISERYALQKRKER